MRVTSPGTFPVVPMLTAAKSLERCRVEQRGGPGEIGYHSSSYCAPKESFVLQLMNSSVRILPCPVSSTLKTSTLGALGRLRILQTPSSTMTERRTTFDVSNLVLPCGFFVRNPQSRNALAKLIHVFPSHFPPPRFCTLNGIVAVSISSSRSSLPSRERNPTMILGTPSRKDWIQNFSSFRSKFSMSRSFRISALVLSSTHLMGAPFSGGLESQTAAPSAGSPKRGHACRSKRTCVHFPAQAEHCFADSRSHDGAVLGLIVYDLLVAGLDEISAGFSPRRRDGREALKFVAW